jgi:hypothetical protein
MLSDTPEGTRTFLSEKFGHQKLCLGASTPSD